MLDSTIRSVIDQVRDEVPWSLVEHFATLPRWKPEDVEASAHEIARRLTGLGVPVDLLESQLYLSIPYDASVEAGGATFAAKPLAYSRSLPDGLTGELVHVPSTLSASTATLLSISICETSASAGTTVE